ncbi:MAG: hypothetical protein ACXWT1_10820 [Methylobacter sp.]
MLILLASATLTAIAKELSARGLDLVSGVFRSQKEEDVNEVSELIKTQTGIDINDAAENKLTEEQWTQLKSFEFENQESLLKVRESINPDEIELELERLAIKDRKDARNTLAKRDENEDVFIRQFTYWYAYVITIATFGFITLAIGLPIYICRDTIVNAECKLIPDESWQIINTVLGFLLGVGLSAIIQFFYGSSQGSRNKDKDMRELNEQISASTRDGEQGGK